MSLIYMTRACIKDYLENPSLGSIASDGTGSIERLLVGRLL